MRSAEGWEAATKQKVLKVVPTTEAAVEAVEYECVKELAPEHDFKPWANTLKKQRAGSQQ